MTTSTQTITEFLRNRIAEDAARVTEPDWYCTDSARGDGWGSRGDCPICDAYMFEGTESATKEAFREHMETFHRRSRVLAECEAKRRIVQDIIDNDYYPAAMVTDGLSARVLDILAAVYADHPDYREEWPEDD